MNEEKKILPLDKVEDFPRYDMDEWMSRPTAGNQEIILAFMFAVCVAIGYLIGKS